MKVAIIVFGQLTDIITEGELVLTDVGDTDAAVSELTRRYPALSNTKYMVAMDKQIINQNTVLKESSTIALLPPFSGG